MYFLGIDAGGSKCRAQLVSDDGQPLGYGAAGPANTRLGTDKVMQSVQDAVKHALFDAGLDETILSETSACMGIAGISRTKVIEEIKQHDFTRGLKQFRIVGDASIANAGAHNGSDGGIIIAGTGSVGYASIDGETVHVGGYGFPASDLGSGAYIGLSAVQHALRAYNGMCAKDLFAEAVLDRLGHSAENFTFDSWTATEYATLAPLVTAHAAEDNGPALQIMKSAADYLAELIDALDSKGAPRISFVGGLAETITPWLPVETQGKLSPAIMPPISGAILMAQRSSNQASLN